MTSSPFFSLVIPTYNRAEFIVKTLQSVIDQTFANFEVWVIDDGSTDGTEEVLASLSDSRLHYFKIPNSERGAARNQGIKLCKGDYVTFLDSDDLLYPDHFQYVRTSLEKQSFPEVYHQAYAIVDTLGLTKKRAIPMQKDINPLLFTVGNVMSCMGVFVKREVAIHNFFNEDRFLSGMEDWELWLRLAARYSIVSDAHITSALVDHGTRSVMQVDREALERKVKLLNQYAYQDKSVKEKYGSLRNSLAGSSLTYVSLHLSECKDERLLALQYFVKGVRLDWRQFFRRRSLAIIRNIIFV